MATSGRYVAIPFEAKRTDIFGNTQAIIQLQKEWQPLEVAGYNQYTTHAGFQVKWAEVPIEYLETDNVYISWSFQSEVCGYVSFTGTGKQAITFFRSLKNRWLLELVPEDSFLVNV